MASHAARNRYSKETVERALSHHGVEHTELSSGNWSVRTGVGYLEMNLRDAWHYVVGLADEERVTRTPAGLDGPAVLDRIAMMISFDGVDESAVLDEIAVVLRRAGYQATRGNVTA